MRKLDLSVGNSYFWKNGTDSWYLHIDEGYEVTIYRQINLYHETEYKLRQLATRYNKETPNHGTPDGKDVGNWKYRYISNITKYPDLLALVLREKVKGTIHEEKCG